MIELKSVTMSYPVPKRYRDYLFRPFEWRYVNALREVSLTIGKGECFGLLGANGSGKTTLLKLVGGLLYPSNGSVKVDGYNTQTANQQVRQKVGFVLNEERSFYWRLTGFQNLDFFGALDNLPRRKRRRRIEELLSLVGLQDAGHLRVSNYSCGMRQRLSIARGLLSRPDILVLDEPTKSLDPVGAEELRSLITNDVHNNHSKTLIIATHNMQEAKDFCGRVCMLKQGRIVACCSAKEASSKHGGLMAYYKTVVSQTT